MAIYWQGGQSLPWVATHTYHTAGTTSPPSLMGNKLSAHAAFSLPLLLILFFLPPDLIKQ